MMDVYGSNIRVGGRSIPVNRIPRRLGCRGPMILDCLMTCKTSDKVFAGGKKSPRAPNLRYPILYCQRPISGIIDIRFVLW